MACYHPVKGIVTVYNGKTKFIPKKGILYPDTPMTVPCGKCLGCRLENSQMWAVRADHELQMHNGVGGFLTLTYNEENYPENGSLVKEHQKNFMKRYRKRFGKGIRAFGCGEYGSKLQRPHYHVMIFGHQLPDLEVFKTVNGSKMYTSEILEELWPFGFSLVAEANYATAAYIARYVTKKINGAMADKHYVSVNPHTGEECSIIPEYIFFSNRGGGIGHAWFEEFKSDVFPSDNLIHNGRHVPTPRYYDKLLERSDPDMHARVKKQRIENFEQLPVEDFTHKRLLDKEKAKQAKIDLFLKRRYENEN